LRPAAGAGVYLSCPQYGRNRLRMLGCPRDALDFKVRHHPLRDRAEK
jgi:hypothetical protein